MEKLSRGSYKAKNIIAFIGISSSILLYLLNYNSGIFALIVADTMRSKLTAYNNFPNGPTNRTAPFGTIPVEKQTRSEQIALIKPTFTAAAYNHAFYKFYDSYDNKVLYAIKSEKNVTRDLNLLTGKIPISNEAYGYEVLNITSHIRQLLPSANVTVITDGDVSEGKIFKKNCLSDPCNYYNTLILGHQEYVTQQEYDNLKKFVADGGTVVLLDGNFFYAEVKYNKAAQTVTLVKGHGWAFNGISAFPSVFERWDKETSIWAGSNFYYWGGIHSNMIFTNIPFSYTHFEEQYVTNPKVKIFWNYGAVYPGYKLDGYPKPTIVVYELNYQKGKVICFSIFSDRVISNYKFLTFFDAIFLKHALA